jgi:uncharacterized protein YeaO (DUF488 family)
VRKEDFSSQNCYDVWYPNLAPSAATMKLGRNARTDKDWQAFARKYRTEMATPENARTLELLAALSHHTNFAVGCYCEDEARCHRSILKMLLIEKNARVADEP